MQSLFYRVCYLSVFNTEHCFFSQVKTVSIVSEETRKELNKMIAQNKELDSLLSKTRSESSAKVCCMTFGAQ